MVCTFVLNSRETARPKPPSFRPRFPTWYLRYDESRVVRLAQFSVALVSKQRPVVLALSLARGWGRERLGFRFSHHTWNGSSSVSSTCQFPIKTTLNQDVTRPLVQRATSHAQAWPLNLFAVDTLSPKSHSRAPSLLALGVFGGVRLGSQVRAPNHPESSPRHRLIDYRVTSSFSLVSMASLPFKVSQTRCGASFTMSQARRFVVRWLRSRCYPIC